MSLETYNARRRFDETPEPQGKTSQTNGSSFVVQKHDARRLHYDFRLEMDGVLKSWAVTRGPSLDPKDKRLAVEVEDHPLSYGDFEGIIPKGHYGAGAVILWDRGVWHPIGDLKKSMKKGHLEFELDGEKLKGRWHLVRMKGKENEKRTNWLLIKGDDDAARPDHGDDLLRKRPESVVSKKDVGTMKKEPDAQWTKGAKRPVEQETAAKTKATRKSRPSTDWPKAARTAKLPDFVEPALATLKPKPPKGEKWLHEIKFDGYRLQARIDGKTVTLLTRSGLDWTAKFGKRLQQALAALPAQTALIDGEVVVETNGGASDFSALQHDLSEGVTDRMVYYAFDLLYLDGHDLRDATLEKRKELLRTLLADAGENLRFSEHFTEAGVLVLEHACRLSLEGIVSKDRNSTYASGRKGQWIKSKCSERQEFVIGGFAPSSTSDAAIGSLALGVFEDGGLRHVGRVGTGFTQSLAEKLYAKLKPLTRKTSPFAGKLDTEARRNLIFVDPEKVAEVEFRAWSADGNLRHASFRGLREDKPAEEVVRETKTSERKTAQQTSVRFSHPDRLYWPDDGVTKEGLAEYYSDIWKWTAPFIVDRPLALLRCPDGIAGPRFFQKHAWRGINRNIHQMQDPKDKSGEPLLRILDVDGVMALVQSGVLEIHPWGTTTKHWEKPDMITMDLDPGDDVEWAMVVDAAIELKERIEKAGLSAFVKTSGGKGLHVVAPLEPKAGWTAVKAFAKKLAVDMAKDDPERYLAVATKAKRRGRIFIDYLRNGRGSTAVAPYSTRARPGAAVSMPVEWSELSGDIGPAYFTVANAGTRLSSLKDDPWADFFEAARPLPK